MLRIDEPMTHPNLIDDARRVALAAHGEQRYGDEPYGVHLEAVVVVLRRFGVESDLLLAAGWLHDVLEDTALGAAELRAALAGHEAEAIERILAIVDACTDGVEGNRAARKERVYRLAPLVPGAVVVKLADRIANVEASRAAADVGRMRMYRGEQGEMMRRLGPGKGDVERSMWAHLEVLLD